MSPLFSAKPKAVLKNKMEVETASMKLSGSKPYLYFKVKSPVRVSVTDRKPFNLSVSVKGLQPIEIYWNKDLRELVIGSRYKTFDNNRRLIVESPFTEEDSGTYSAIACNTKGCEVRGVQVMFHCKYTNIEPPKVKFHKHCFKSAKTFYVRSRYIEG